MATAALRRFPGVLAVTGAGGTGIGAAVAKAFARAGCERIAITDINSNTLSQTKEAILSINKDATIFSRAGDVSDEGFISPFMEEVFFQFKRLDYAVNCAGILGLKTARSTEFSAEAFDKLNGVNYRGCWLSSRAELTQMLKQDPLPEHPEQRGAIVNIASQLGIVGRPGAAAYCGSKGAIINMTRADAIDYSDDQIRINCVCPGVIETPMVTSSLELHEDLKQKASGTPMKRLGKPEEVADAVMFLCSSQASFVQGHALVVDGGYTIL